MKSELVGCPVEGSAVPRRGQLPDFKGLLAVLSKSKNVKTPDG